MNIDVIKAFQAALNTAVEKLSCAEEQLKKINATNGVNIRVEIKPNRSSDYLGIAFDDTDQIGFDLLTALDREYKNIAFSAENDIKNLLLTAPQIYVDAQFVDNIPF